MASLFDVPVSGVLERAKNVLVAGAGGGFDVFAGVPLFLSLTRAGKQVTLANLSFTYLPGTSAALLAEGLWLVAAQSQADEEYFPEKYLAEWLSTQGHAKSIYAFEKVGVRQLREAYRYIVAEHEIDTIILVDGGTDILMRGDESGLGTPAEDMLSLASVHGLDVPRKLVSCLGFGVDAFHGVCHAHFLENVAALSRAGGYLGTHSLHTSMPEVAQFCEAVAYAHARMPDLQSIVNGSILSALEGRFGNFQRTTRTQSSELFINPLMSMYWHFDLKAVAEHSLYLALLEGTDDIFSIQSRIEAFRKTITPRKARRIPV